jgi:hypothetical protein
MADKGFWERARQRDEIRMHLILGAFNEKLLESMRQKNSAQV